MKTLIRGGRVIDPLNKIDDILDILIENNTIIKVEKSINDYYDKLIDAKDKWVCPGLIDLHVHLRDPGLTYKEDILTGAESAKVGGFTTICAMPNTKPVTDNPEILDYVFQKGMKTGINVFPISSITKEQKGKDLVDFEINKDYAIAFSEDGLTVSNAHIMHQALKLSDKVKKPIFSHCEDHFLKNGGQIHKGTISKKLGLKGITPLAEDIIVNRDVLLAKENNSKLHICHIATKGSVDIIREHKKYNQNLTAEICPHHFVLCDENIKELDSNFKMAPPLRSKSDVSAMIQALKDGTIDTIATDHAPHTEDEKSKDFINAPNGIVGLETLLPLTITYLVKENILTPSQFVEKTSLNPAKIINLDRGHLSIGSTADITIIDTETKYTIKKQNFKSKSKNSPFDNFEVYGLAEYVICNGVIVHSIN